MKSRTWCTFLSPVRDYHKGNSPVIIAYTGVTLACLHPSSQEPRARFSGAFFGLVLIIELVIGNIKQRTSLVMGVGDEWTVKDDVRVAWLQRVSTSLCEIWRRCASSRGLSLDKCEQGIVAGKCQWLAPQDNSQKQINHINEQLNDEHKSERKNMVL